MSIHVHSEPRRPAPTRMLPRVTIKGERDAFPQRKGGIGECDELDRGIRIRLQAAMRRPPLSTVVHGCLFMVSDRHG